MQQGGGSLTGAMQKSTPLGAGALNTVQNAINTAKTAVTSRLPKFGPSGGGGGSGGSTTPPTPPAGTPPRRVPPLVAGGSVLGGTGLAAAGIYSLLNKTQNKPQVGRSEKLVGSANKGGLKADPKSDENAKNINKRGGMSLASGGTGYLAKKGDSYVIKKAKAIGSDDGFIGQAARSLGLTKDKDKAAEAARQKISNTNRVKYLGNQGLTSKNQAGYMAKGAKLGGMKTGENILKAHFEMWVDGLLAEGYDLSNYTWDGLYEEYIQIISE
jgi:hypothetical protein